MNILQRLATSTFYQEHETDGTHSDITATTLNIDGTTGNTLIVETSGLVYDATNNRVGIGTASPSWAFHVNGGTANQVALFESTDSIGLAYFKDNATSTDSQVAVGAIGDDLRFIAGGSSKMQITSTGLTGIGVNAPAELLEIEDANATTTLQISNTAADGDPQLAFALSGTKKFTMGVDDGDSDKFKIGTTAIGTSTRMTIDSSGNVGIGTATPDRTLHVHTATAGVVTAPTAADDLTVENSGDGGISVLVPDANNAQIYLGSPSDSIGAYLRWNHDANLATWTTHKAAGELAFGTAGAIERMRIDSAGNVGIGDSAPDAQLVVNDDVFIGDAAASGNTAHGNVTRGLTINMETADDIAFALKSADFATGLTTATAESVETDDFFTISKVTNTHGGARMQIMCTDDTTETPWDVRVYGGTADTDKTTAATALANFIISEHNGANAIANITEEGNIFVIRARVGAATVARFLIDEDGDMYSVTAGQTFDDYDDLALVEAYDAVRSDYGDFAVENEQKLIELGVLGAPVKDGGLTNVTQLQRLHNGAIRQMYRQLQETLERLDIAENKLQLLEAN